MGNVKAEREREGENLLLFVGASMRFGLALVNPYIRTEKRRINEKCFCSSRVGGVV